MVGDEIYSVSRWKSSSVVIALGFGVGIFPEGEASANFDVGFADSNTRIFIREPLRFWYTNSYQIAFESVDLSLQDIQHKKKAS